MFAYNSIMNWILLLFLQPMHKFAQHDIVLNYLAGKENVHMLVTNKNKIMIQSHCLSTRKGVKWYYNITLLNTMLFDWYLMLKVSFFKVHTLNYSIL